jgi:hypothetical protein
MLFVDRIVDRNSWTLGSPIGMKIVSFDGGQATNPTGIRTERQLRLNTLFRPLEKERN